jgi:ferric-dicitrate binding protein FerR (iron transport regulator)
VNPNVKRVLILAEAVCAGGGTEREVAELRDLLHNDPEALDAYLRFTDLHVTLATGAEPAATGSLVAADFTAARPRLKGWLVYAVACAALVLIGVFVSRHKTQQPEPDLSATIASTEKAIAQMPTPSFSPLPSWMSPTASMLDQPGSSD